jgi:hypothetical protein
MLWDIDLIFDIWNYNDELQIKFSVCSHWIILAKLLSLDFRILHSIQIVLSKMTKSKNKLDVSERYECSRREY